MTTATVDYTYDQLDVHFFRNTCCAMQRVVDLDGVEYMALWNGLASWLKILSFANGKDLYGGVNVHEVFQTEVEEDEDGLFQPNAGLYLALESGYQEVID